MQALGINDEDISKGKRSPTNLRYLLDSMLPSNKGSLRKTDLFRIIGLLSKILASYGSEYFIYLLYAYAMDPEGLIPMDTDLQKFLGKDYEFFSSFFAYLYFGIAHVRMVSACKAPECVILQSDEYSKLLYELVLNLPLSDLDILNKGGYVSDLNKHWFLKLKSVGYDANGVCRKIEFRTAKDIKSLLRTADCG